MISAPGGPRRVPSARAALVALVAIAIAGTLAGCGGSSGGTSHSSSSSSPPAATRWWSNSAVTVGSTVSPADPEAAAARLSPSQADYCGMLKQTLAANKSLVSAITATDPALAVSARAFLAEIQRVAPASVTGQWHVLGPAVLELVKSGGTSGLPSNLGALTSAANAISSDAQTNCGVDLSSVLSLLPGK